MNRFLSRLGPLARGIATLIGGAAGAQIIGLAVYPILTRMYTAEAFGLLAVYTALVSLINTVSSLQYEMAIPLPRERQGGAAVLFVALYANVLAAVIVLAVFSFFPGAVPLLLGVPSVDGALLLLVPLGVLLAGTYQVFSMWAVRERDYGSLAATRVTQQGVTSLLQLGGAFAGWGGVALVGSSMIGSGVGIARLGRAFSRAGGTSVPPAREVLRAARRHWKFAVVGTPSAVLNSVSTESRAVLLSSLFTLASAGQFSLAMKVIGIPLQLLGSSLERVFYGEASRLGRGDPRGILALVGAFTKRALLAGIVPALALVIFAPTLFSFVFGEEWLVAGEYARFLAVYMLATLTASPFTSVFLIFGKQHYLLALTGVKAALAVGSFVIPHALGAGSVAAIAVYSATLGAYYVVMGLVARGVLRAEARTQDAGSAE